MPHSLTQSPCCHRDLGGFRGGGERSVRRSMCDRLLASN
ncbi:hypothetical protein SynRS9909_01328 [Synechococcus sp. RS9909]|nr:hypothetical protein SynRS9909_01328 [Synechococcus sp. RS9909]